jgi:predicted nucleic acid-binding protein
MRYKRAHVLLREGLVREIDAIAGRRGRSAFLVKNRRRRSSSDPPPAQKRRILLDTTVLLDALRARKDRRELLAQLVREEGHELSTTALNIAELYAGMRPREERGTAAFLADFLCFIIDQTIARASGHFKAQWARKGRTLAIVDCTVAAVAIHNQCVLATDNRKDFPMPEVQLYPLP